MTNESKHVSASAALNVLFMSRQWFYVQKCTFQVVSVVLCGLIGKITRVTLNGTFYDIQLDADLGLCPAVVHKINRAFSFYGNGIPIKIGKSIPFFVTIPPFQHIPSLK